MEERRKRERKLSTHDESDDRDSSKDAESDGQHGQLTAGEDEVGGKRASRSEGGGSAWRESRRRGRWGDGGEEIKGGIRRSAEGDEVETRQSQRLHREEVERETTHRVTLAVSMLPIVVSPINPSPLATIEPAARLCIPLGELALSSALVSVLLCPPVTALEIGAAVVSKEVSVSEVIEAVGEVMRAVAAGGVEDRDTVISETGRMKVDSRERPSPASEVLMSLRVEPTSEMVEELGTVLEEREVEERVLLADDGVDERADSALVACMLVERGVEREVVAVVEGESVCDEMGIEAAVVDEKKGLLSSESRLEEAAAAARMLELA